MFDLAGNAEIFTALTGVVNSKVVGTFFASAETKFPPKIHHRRKSQTFPTVSARPMANGPSFTTQIP